MAARLNIVRQEARRGFKRPTSARHYSQKAGCCPLIAQTV